MVLIIKIEYLENYTLFCTQDTRVSRVLCLELEGDFIEKYRQEMLEFLLKVVMCANYRRVTMLWRMISSKVLRYQKRNGSSLVVGFITDFPKTSSGGDSIMTVIDKATQIIHVVLCNKIVTVAETAQLYWRYVVKLHGRP